MGKLRGFLEIRRVKPDARPIGERLRDYHEFERDLPDASLKDQAGRCMDCGIPFCHDGCPLGNLIPEWNDQMYGGRLSDAIVALHATNNFPEVTGRVCPAPCEASCVLNIPGSGPGMSEPVTIKNIERGIIDRAFAAGLVTPQPALLKTGRSVAVVGSGPAGLAAAQQLARRGHAVTVFERDDRPGGLLRYGIPDFKLDKGVLDRRLEQLAAEGVVFVNCTRVGVDVTGDDLRARFDAVVLAGGAQQPRDLTVPGRELDGVHFAMDFLTQQNRRVAGLPVGGPDLLATGKRVVVLGGGDTGSDCVGTSHRQGAAHVRSLEIMPRPPSERRDDNPWPAWPLIYRTSSSHEEGGDREFATMTKRVVGANGRVTALETVQVDLAGGKITEVPGSETLIPADLVLLAMGFTGPITTDVVAQLGCALDRRGNVATTRGGVSSVLGVFAAGDMARGQSLVVWAIAEGRRTADAIEKYFVGGGGRG